MNERTSIGRRIFTVVLILALALCGAFFEKVKEWFPWLIALQLRSYSWISEREIRQPRANWVVAVEIDDKTFYDYMHLGEGDRTDRAKLGELIRVASRAEAAVIALDMDLAQDSAESEKPREEANCKLLDAISSAVKDHHVPVILTTGFEPNGQQQTNIYKDDQLPYYGDRQVNYRARVGFDYAAEDLRKVPLAVDRMNSEGKTQEFSSFALETVDAYEDIMGIIPRTRKRLSGPIADRVFLYTTFLSTDIPAVSAADILQDVDAGRESTQMNKLRHRIVLIGGHRKTRKGGAEWLDNYSLPPLELTGMYFQANYIEGLLDNRIKSPVSKPIAFILDVLVALAMILYSRRAKSLLSRLVLLGVCFLPVLLAYIAAVNLGYVLDCVLPLLLLFLHAVIDHYIHLWKLARLGKESLAHAH
ncbi:MAG TPA: CHASE2 domain-containing protein [Candidatus Dormibacteraeota bacterium]|nr:CHASE2 domain-containing protein [Candidatus Dormibacteraeota bacterium]